MPALEQSEEANSSEAIVILVNDFRLVSKDRFQTDIFDRQHRKPAQPLPVEPPKSLWRCKYTRNL